MKTAGYALAFAMLSAACAHAVPEHTALVQVYRSDGSRQCETGSGSPPPVMQRVLEAAGIPVEATRRDQMRDSAFPAVCGGATGSVNVYTIAAKHMPKAQALGFALWRAAREE